MQDNIIVDTDPGVDDALALIYCYRNSLNVTTHQSRAILVTERVRKFTTYQAIGITTKQLLILHLVSACFVQLRMQRLLGGEHQANRV